MAIAKMKEMIIRYHPVRIFIQKSNRKRLKNHDFTLLTSNCIGGIISNELGEKFLSPTVNTRIDPLDFIKFVANLREYLSLDLVFVDAVESFPVAKLGDVLINFVHYKTREEAETKWMERKKRINWNNVWIITNDVGGLSEKDIEMLKSINYARGIALFSTRKYYDADFVYQMPKDEKGELINYLSIDKLRGVRKFALYFDHVAWLNGSLTHSFSASSSFDQSSLCPQQLQKV